MGSPELPQEPYQGLLQPPHTHIEVPEGEDSDDHGRGGPAPATGAVEHEGCPRVLSQGALHGLQQPVKVLPG